MTLGLRSLTLLSVFGRFHAPTHTWCSNVLWLIGGVETSGSRVQSSISWPGTLPLLKLQCLFLGRCSSGPTWLFGLCGYVSYILLQANHYMLFFTLPQLSPKASFSTILVSQALPVFIYPTIRSPCFFPRSSKGSISWTCWGLPFKWYFFLSLWTFWPVVCLQ